jgi:hypothetical protein
MKMEFLDATGNGEYPNASPKFLIRLYKFTDDGQKKLIECIDNFLLNKDQSMELHSLPFIQTINCFVTLEQSEENASSKNSM